MAGSSRTADRLAPLTGALLSPATWITACVAGLVFAIAYADGGYSLASRSTVAVAVWWAILVGVAVGVWPLEPVRRAAVITGSLLALLALWTLASAAWAVSAENVVDEFDRLALYLGVFVLVVAAARARQLASWVDGLSVAVTAVALLALASRFFPGLLSDRGVAEMLPSTRGRLSFPLGYWNGLGIFTAMAVPLLLHSTLGGRPRRLVSVGVLPAVGAVVYLTSSRGAVAAMAVGVLVSIAAESRRVETVGACLAGAAGTAAAIAATHLGGAAAAIAVVLVGGATAAGFELARGSAPSVPVSEPLRRRLTVAAGVAVLVASIVVVVVTRPWRDFTQLPATTSAVSGKEHLLSGSGSGRWQFWQAAADEFARSPLHGGGAGSYEAWWARHGSFAYAVKDAHSLYVETLGELGAVGFLLLAGALATGVVVAVRRLRMPGSDRSAIAALLGAFATYLVGAGTDWMWELPVVTVVAVCVLGLLTGPATLPPQAGAAAARRRLRLPQALAAAVACAVVIAEGIALLGDVEVRRSEAAARAGHPSEARSHAVAATKIEPWAATPYLRLALAEEGAGDLASARRAIGRATRRDPSDWRLWLVAARIESRLGDPEASARSRARARSLNPRSPLVAAPR